MLPVRREAQRRCGVWQQGRGCAGDGRPVCGGRGMLVQGTGARFVAVGEGLPVQRTGVRFVVGEVRPGEHKGEHTCRDGDYFPAAVIFPAAVLA